MKFARFAAATLCAASGFALPSQAQAQGAAAFPSKPITIIVPAPPGGAIDITARLIGQKLTDAWGKPVVIENKAGATGTIGTDAVGKANPGQLTFASSGPGGAPHMSGELFRSMAGIDMLHVPYKGSTAAHADLLGGRTSLMFDTVAAINPHVKAGSVRALAVTTAKRSSVAPDVPTMAEAGLKGYETSTWGGVLAPAGTPRDVVAKLNAEMNKALAAPDVRQKMLGAGIEPAGGTPQQFADFLQAEIVKWGSVARAAGIEPE